mgnify:CR=1 FL=1
MYPQSIKIVFIYKENKVTIFEQLNKGRDVAIADGKDKDGINNKTEII